MSTFRRRVGIVGFLATAVTTCVLNASVNAYGTDRPKQVLVLNSTRHDEQFSVVSEREVPRLLSEGLGEDVDYYTEYFDWLRFPPAQYQDVYLDFLRLKYEGKHFDLVILMGSVAIDFMSRHGNTLFGGAPAVFYSFRPPPTRIANSTGLINPFHFYRSIDLAVALQPDLKHLYVVSGAGESDRQFERQVREEFHRYEPRLEFTYLAGLRTKDLEQRLRTLPPRSAVFYLLVSQDGAGEHFQQMDYVSRVASAANAPTYSWTDAAVDSGIVGGSRRDQAAETKAIAALALRILRGERTDDIPVSSASMDVDKVDWRQLRRWGISEARVPPGTMVLFREPTAWDRYKRYIVGSLTLMAAQTALIAGLLVQRARRRRAEQQLRDSQNKLRESYDRIRHLGRRLLGAQETERAFIARELHDDINQRLALLSIELDSLRCSPQEVERAKRLSRALEQAYKISTSVHELSRRLHPSILHMIGLVAAIDNLQRDFSRPDQIVVYTHRDVPDVIEHDIALCLFRVAQEALRNAAKHSDARHLYVDLAGTDGSLALTITDDGKGFDVDQTASDGLGLTSMRERLESVGGVLELQATPGSGTRVKATVPIGAPTGAMVPT